MIRIKEQPAPIISRNQITGKEPWFLWAVTRSYTKISGGFVGGLLVCVYIYI